MAVLSLAIISQVLNSTYLCRHLLMCILIHVSAILGPSLGRGDLLGKCTIVKGQGPHRSADAWYSKANARV